MSDENCDVTLNTSVITTYNEYKTERDNRVSAGVSASADMSATIKGITVKAGVAASLQMSTEEQKIYEAFTQDYTEVTRATAACYTKDIAISTVTRPKFTVGFYNGLRSLELAAANTDENLRRFEYVAFTEGFGTHYMGNTQMGATYTVEKIHRGRSSSVGQRQARQTCIDRAANACVGGGVADATIDGCMGQKNSECESALRETTESTGSTQEETIIRTSGATPTSLQNWTQATFSAVPVKIDLVPLENLLTTENLAADTSYNVATTLNGANILALLEEGLDKWYLSDVVELSQADLDNPPATGCGIDDDCQPGEICQMGFSFPSFEYGPQCDSINLIGLTNTVKRCVLCFRLCRSCAASLLRQLLHVLPPQGPVGLGEQRQEVPARRRHRRQQHPRGLCRYQTMVGSTYNPFVCIAVLYNYSTV